jgi:hypothetical protein
LCNFQQEVIHCSPDSPISSPKPRWYFRLSCELLRGFRLLASAKVNFDLQMSIQILGCFTYKKKKDRVHRFEPKLQMVLGTNAKALVYYKD